MPEAYDYEVTSVSNGCTKYRVGDKIIQWYVDTPPDTITLNYASPCNEVKAKLINE